MLEFKKLNQDVVIPRETKKKEKGGGKIQKLLTYI